MEPSRRDPPHSAFLCIPRSHFPISLRADKWWIAFTLAERQTMKALLQHRWSGKVAGLFLFLLPGSAMAHPGHGGAGVFHHLPGPLEVLLALTAAGIAFHLGSRNSRA